MKCVTAEEIEQMLALIDERDPMGVRDINLIRLMCHTGLRVGEACGLDVGDVYANAAPRQSLYVRPEIAKGSRGRVVPLNSVARHVIARQVNWLHCRGFCVAPDAPLFVSKGHRRLTTRAVQYLFKELRERAQIAVPITPHSARHHFASRVAETTGNVSIVARLLGHRRLDTSGIYVHSSPEELARAVDPLCPAERGPDGSAPASPACRVSGQNPRIDSPHQTGGPR
jgi:site-specific recombinase XerC